jgi:hypothetical protein
MATLDRVVVVAVEKWWGGIDIPSAALLNFGDVELEKIVQPSKKLLSAIRIAVSRQTATETVVDIRSWMRGSRAYLDSPMMKARRSAPDGTVWMVLYEVLAMEIRNWE